MTDRWHCRLQPLTHDFGDVLHVQLLAYSVLPLGKHGSPYPSPSRTRASTLFSENAGGDDSCPRLRRISSCKSRTSTSSASSAWRRDMRRRTRAATICLRRDL